MCITSPHASNTNCTSSQPGSGWPFSGLATVTFDGKQYNESPRLPAGGKRDKGKARMRDERPEEQGDSGGMQQEHHAESKKRRPPQSTGQLWENTWPAISKDMQEEKKAFKSAPMVISSNEDEGANVGHQRTWTFGDLDKGKDDLLDHIHGMQQEMDLVNSWLHTTKVMLNKCQNQVEDYWHFTQELLECMHNKDQEVAKLMDCLQRAEELLEMISGYEEDMDERDPMASIPSTVKENALALPVMYLQWDQTASSNIVQRG
ncbi:hypothetical protein BYT27DRAFT_7252815 [Phlegmacium glaucopus]|nr:hypothetical protein BYT27DRAFT_7252815 [Phlegmacium glaucopus]